MSFPAFNVLPLFEPRSEVKKAAVELRKSITSKWPPSVREMKQRLEAMAGNSNFLWVAKEPTRITKCLASLPRELATSLGTPPDEFRSIIELVERAGKLTLASLHTQLVSIVIGKIVETPNTATNWFDIVVGERSLDEPA